MTKLLLAPLKLLTLLVGRFNWAPPVWISFIYNFLKTHLKIAAGVVLLAVAAFGIHHYLDGLPKKITVKAELSEIALMGTGRSAAPSSLDIRFEYDYDSLNEGQVQPTGTPSVARIDLVGKVIEAGINLTPAKNGVWTWDGDNRIVFKPETDWPAGTEYSVTFTEELFSEQTILSTDSYAFETPDFSASFSATEFYQDPKDSSIRRVVSTLSFSHPVDKASLEENLSMGMQAEKATDLKKIKPHGYAVSYSKNLREAYITSTAVTLPSEPNYMKLVLAHNVKSLLGGQGSRQAIESKVLVPDLYSYLKVTSARIQIVRNEKNEPEQILMLEFTDEIDQQELLSKLSLYHLARWSNGSGRGRANAPRLVNPKLLARSKKITLDVIANERNSSSIYSFRIDVPESEYIYIFLNEKLTSVNDFVYASFYDEVLSAPYYPKEVTIAGDGAVLTHSGNHQLSVLTRGVTALKYSVGKLVEGQINHLVSQTYGDITNPSFANWKFNKYDISEVETKIVDLQSTHAKNANYSSLDLSEYLPQQQNRFGLFFVEVSAWDKSRKREINPRDKRLILVTDLGIIVKDNADKSHHVFVQSIANGEPVVGAQVSLLGKNGIALSTVTSDEKGHAFFAPTFGYQREKEPTVYVVKTENDMSFIPFERAERQINLSKFDIGGVRSTSASGQSLNGFLFSDRGIYRPGETINLGIIVKNDDLSNIDGIPLELVIRDPRSREVSVERYQLPEIGFSDFQFPTELTTDTGQYSVSLHLVSERGYRTNEIGNTRFKVEEFQPDTMKIESKLEGTSAIGWNMSDKVSATVSLSNLFGTAAQDRKVTASVIIEPQIFNFTKFENYRFTETKFDGSQKALRLNQELATKQTDNDGQVKYDIDLSRFKSGTYRMRFLVEGFDQAGGRSVRASNSILTSPLTQLVGYKPDGDLNYISAASQRRISFIAINPQLEPLLASDLSLQLIEIQHVSTLVKQANGTYKYQTITKEVDVSNTSMSIPKSGFDYDIDTARPGDFAIEVRDANQQRVSRLEYSVAGFANLAGKIDKNAELQLKLDKQDYFPGDVIKMSLKAPYFGAGLISIETDKVHTFKWFKTDQESTVQEITLPDDVEGTAYINVAFVRDVSSKEIFTSPLSYAVQPFSIDKGKRRVDIDLSAQELVRPGKPMEIKYSTSKPAKIAIFAVDEGILQVANYSTPDPLSHYLKKRALDVQTMQILDLILPDFNILKELSASGGGSGARKALAKNLNPFARKTDKPAVFWSGIYDADTETKSINFNIPNSFAGELRLMAVAVAEEAIGAESRSAIVRGPFVISPNVLTAAAPGDEFDVTVGVANIIEGSGKDVPIELSVIASDNLELIGPASGVLTIDEGSEGKLNFRVKAKQKLGAAELKFVAKHGDEELFRTAGLSVRPAMTYRTSIESGVVDNGKVKLPLTRRLYTNLAEQSISASASPLVIVDGLSSYLQNYPHGCTEQIVSKVFPLIGLMSHERYAPHQPDVNKQLAYLISKLRTRQTGDGGFSFWPGVHRGAEYPTIYAMHFLIEAQAAGYPVPADMLQRGKSFLMMLAQSQSGGSLLDARNRANAIYVLTRMGVVTSNYLVDLEEGLLARKSDDWQDGILSSYMAATYKLLQKDSEASRLIANYKIASKRPRGFDDFNSILSTDAQHLYLLSKHFPAKVKKLDSKIILGLTEKVNKGEYNTISAAYTMLALGEYSKLALAKRENENIEFASISADDKRTILNAAAKPFLTAEYGTEATVLNASADSGLFYLNVQSGFDRDFPEKAVKQGIEIYREFVDDEGKIVTEFEQGKEITARLKIRSLDESVLTNIAVIDLLPGGFEIIRSSVPRTAYDWQADYVDVREDRVLFYGSFGSRITELSYKVKLTASGTFMVPPSYAESMYDRSIRAITPASTFTVISAK